VLLNDVESGHARLLHAAASVLERYSLKDLDVIRLYVYVNVDYQHSILLAAFCFQLRVYQINNTRTKDSY
jgi:hypothetical protein